MPPIYYGSAPFALKQGSQALNLYYGSTLISGGGGVTVPQTAVIFGDSGWHYGWRNQTDATGGIVAINGTGTKISINFDAVNLEATYIGDSMYIAGSSVLEVNGVRSLSKITTGTANSAVTTYSTHSDGRIKVTSALAVAAGDVIRFDGTSTGTGLLTWYVKNRAYYVYEVLDASNFTLDGPMSITGTASGGNVRKSWSYEADYNGGAFVQAVPQNATVGVRVTLPFNRVTHRSSFHWMQSVLGYPFDVLNFAACNAQGTDGMTPRLSRDVYAYNPGWVFCHFGANDVRVQGLSAATAITNTQAILSDMRANLPSAKIVFLCWFPDDQRDIALFAANVNAKALEFDTAMRAYCSANNILFVSQWDLLLNPVSDPDSAYIFGTNPNYYGALYSDGVHCSQWGAQKVGTALADVIRPYVTDNKATYLPQSDTDYFAATPTSTNYFINPLLTTATGGVVGTGGSGVAASGLRVYRDQYGGLPTFVASVVPRTDIHDGDTLGNNQKVVIAPVAAGNAVNIKASVPTPGDFAIGDYVECSCMVSMDATAAANEVTNIAAILVFNDTLNTWASAIIHPSFASDSRTYDYLPDVISKQMFVTARAKVNAIPTQVSLVMQVNTSIRGTSGSITLEVGRIAIRKVAGIGVA